MLLIQGNIMILITYSTNETLEFPTVSQAKAYSLDLLICGIVALGIRCDNASDLNHLQDYLAGIHSTIKS